MQLNLFRINLSNGSVGVIRMIKCVISCIKEEALDIKSFTIQPIDKSLNLPSYTPGAHIDLHLKNGVVRQYSLVGSIDGKNEYKVAVLKDKDSRGGSETLHLTYKVGDELTISEPRNLFPLNLNSEKYILFAGGIGITPIISMALYLSEIKKDFELHYFCRSLENIAFHQEIISSDFANNVFFHLDSDSSTKANLEEIIGTTNLKHEIYICGPAGFIDYILNSAREFGWHNNNLNKESFKNIIETVNDESFELVLAKSNRTFIIPQEKTVLDILLENDCEVESSCEQGICGACVLEVLEGEPDHKDQFLTDQEKQKNDCFTPCCSRSKSKRLVINL